MFESFWQIGIKSQAVMDAEMKDRVVIPAIYAARVADRKDKTECIPETVDTDSSIGPMMGMANSAMKHHEGGTRGSYMAALYHTKLNIKRRDELIAKYKTTTTTEEEEKTATTI